MRRRRLPLLALLVLAALAASVAPAAGAATGLVIFPATGTTSVFSTTPFDGTVPAANAFDGNLFNAFASSASSGGYVGLQFASPVVVTEFWIANQPNVGDGTIRCNGAKLQGSNTSQTAGLVDLYAFGPTESAPWGRQKAIDLTNTTAYTYYRYLSGPAHFTGLGELTLIGPPNAAVPMKCLPVQCFPAHGHFAVDLRVVLSCRTTSAAIYYTTDGTDPTTSSTLYSGPFTIAATTTIKAIAHDASCTDSDIATFHLYRDQQITLQGVSLDGGSTGYVPADPTAAAFDPLSNDKRNWTSPDVRIDPATGLYIACGEKFYPDWNASKDEGYAQGVNAYASGDLLNWWPIGPGYEHAATRRVASLFTADTPALLAAITGFTEWRLERPTWVYNASTHKWVMYVHADAPDYSAGLVLVATADAPAGPWTVVSCGQLDGHCYDHKLFVDDDGTGYWFHRVNGTGPVTITKLSADYLSSVATVTNVNIGEGLALFKRNGQYGLVSGSGFWNDASFSKTYRASNAIFTDWGAITSSALTPDPGTDDVGAFRSQPCSIVKLNGYADAWVFFGDNWTYPQINSPTVMLPLSFPTGGSTAQLGTSSPWSIADTFGAGTPPLAPGGLRRQGSTLVWRNTGTAGAAQLYLERAADAGFTTGLRSYVVPLNVSGTMPSAFADPENTASASYYRLRAVGTGGASLSGILGPATATVSAGAFVPAAAHAVGAVSEGTFVRPGGK